MFHNLPDKLRGAWDLLRTHHFVLVTEKNSRAHIEGIHSLETYLNAKKFVDQNIKNDVFGDIFQDVFDIDEDELEQAVNELIKEDIK